MTVSTNCDFLAFELIIFDDEIFRNSRGKQKGRPQDFTRQRFCERIWSYQKVAFVTEVVLLIKFKGLSVMIYLKLQLNCHATDEGLYNARNLSFTYKPYGEEQNHLTIVDLKPLSICLSVFLERSTFENKRIAQSDYANLEAILRPNCTPEEIITIRPRYFKYQSYF